MGYGNQREGLGGKLGGALDKPCFYFSCLLSLTEQVRLEMENFISNS